MNMSQSSAANTNTSLCRRPLMMGTVGVVTVILMLLEVTSCKIMVTISFNYNN